MRLTASPFDSKFYGLRIGRLVAEPGDDPAALDRQLACARDEYDAVFVRLDETDLLCNALEHRGWPAIDRLVVSELQSGGSVATVKQASTTVTHHERLEKPEDIEAIISITSSIRTSHLHADPRLPLEQTRALYAEWARNDVTGRAIRTLVARQESEVVGYITIVKTDEGLALDLVAVREDQQGRGIGSAMLTSTLAWVTPMNTVVTVGTQATNPALALYRRFGFVPRRTYLTYHLWLTEQ